MPMKRFAPASLNSSGATIRPPESEIIELPEFDSLLPAAGLSNLQAFQLSLRHALALLPRLPGHILAARDEADLPERFFLR